MQFQKEELLNFIDEISNGDELDSSKIPDIDLYMDQVIQLFENYLSNTKRNEEDKILTKTMINNYSKEKLLLPTKNKKYSKEHIILMLLTYDLKQILSIGDIKKLFTPMVEGTINGDKNIDIVSIYNKYLALKEKQREEEKKYIANLIDIVDEICEDKDNENNEESEYEKNLLLLLTMINNSADNKRITEKILDNNF